MAVEKPLWKSLWEISTLPVLSASWQKVPAGLFRRRAHGLAGGKVAGSRLTLCHQCCFKFEPAILDSDRQDEPVV